MRPILIQMTSRVPPLLMRLIIVAAVTVQLAVHSFTGVTPVHNAIVDAAQAAAKPIDVVLPNVAPAIFTDSEFIYQRCQRHNETYLNGDPVGFEMLSFELIVWPPHGIPTGPRSYEQHFLPLFAAVFALLLMLVPPFDPIGKRRALAALAASLVVTLPLPVLASFLPKFWYALTTNIPSTAIARAGVEPLGAWITWSGVLLLYAVVYLKLRPLTAQRTDADACRHCGYDITSLDACPECNTPRGSGIARARRRKAARRLAPAALPAALMLAPLWITWSQALF